MSRGFQNITFELLNVSLIILSLNLQVRCNTLAENLDAEADVDHDISAVVGQKSFFPCNVNPPAVEDSVYIVLWYKNTSGLPVYTYRTDGSHYSVSAPHAVHTKLEHRSFFRVAWPAGLTVQVVREEDGGIYTCRVDFRTSPSQYTKINFTVIVPPKIIWIESNGKKAASVLGPFNEGASITLTCLVRGGNPAPKIVWLLNNITKFVSDVRIVNGVAAGDITLPILRRNDLMSSVTCQANNNNVSRPIQVTARIDLNLRPLTVSVTGLEKPLSTSHSHELSCISSGGRPATELTWWKQGSPVVSSDIQQKSADGNTTTNHMRFTFRPEDDATNISCRAINPSFPRDALDAVATIIVHYVPQVLISLGHSLDPTDIAAGDDVYFECIIKANPPAKKVMWLHENDFVKQDKTNGIILINQTLVLQKVQRHNAGIYRCMAENTEGRNESDGIELHVKYTPVCSENQKFVYSMMLGEKIDITCDVHAEPKAVTFSWVFNNTAEVSPVHPSKYTSNATHSHMIYTADNEFSYGSLLCWAKNKMGSQDVPCVYHIQKAGPPDSLENCTILNTSTDTLNVDCISGSNGGLNQHFIMEVWAIDGNSLRANVSSSTPSFVLQGLDENENLKIIVYASNSKGISDKLELSTVVDTNASNLQDASVSRPQLNPVMLAVLGGILLLLIFLSVAFVTMLASHRKSKKKKRWKKSKTADKSTSPMLGGSTDERDPDLIPQLTDTNVIENNYGAVSSTPITPYSITSTSRQQLVPEYSETVV